MAAGFDRRSVRFQTDPLRGGVKGLPLSPSVLPHDMMQRIGTSQGNKTMLFHLSIAAHDPRNVAQVIAEIWGGEALPFPPVSDNGWIALADDDRGSAIEVYPVDTVLREAEGDADAYGETAVTSPFTATHAAIATALDEGAVMAIAAREGWPAKYRKRGGAFGVIEMWIERRQMVEILTPPMQAEYLASVSVANWRAMLNNAPA